MKFGHFCTKFAQSRRSFNGGACAGREPLGGSGVFELAAAIHGPRDPLHDERVFSLLKNMFGTEPKACLADYIQAALMLAYNKRAVG